MKKFKKLLLGLCCFALLFTSCFCLTACNPAEESKNVVNSTTDILPFEYSQAAATNILMAAYTNSLKQNFYKSTYSGQSFLNGIKQENSPKYESYFFTKDGKNAIAYREISNPEAKTHMVTTISNTSYNFNIDAKTYSTNTNTALTYSLVVQKSACENVISGKYYQGADHVYGVLDNSSMIIYYEWVIKDNLIVEINQFTSISEFNYGFINQTFDYTTVDQNTLPAIPTSLDGYTAE